MIDIHILHMRCEPLNWLIHAYATALRNCPGTGAVRIFPGVPGALAASRLAGYQAGTEKYVTFVDSDDRLLAPYYEQACAAFDENPKLEMVFPRVVTSDGIETEGAYGAVYRRATIERLYPVMSEPFSDDMIWCALFDHSKMLRLNVIGYWKRHHARQISRLTDDDEHAQVRARATQLKRLLA